MTSLLSREVGVVQAAQYAAVGKSSVAFLLREERLWNTAQVVQRARRASPNAYLAFGFVIKSNRRSKFEDQSLILNNHRLKPEGSSQRLKVGISAARRDLARV